jgi:hypothetical protein
VYGPSTRSTVTGKAASVTTAPGSSSLAIGSRAEGPWRRR